jgi:arylformamidase
MDAITSTPIYRDYDQATLDAQYNNQNKISQAGFQSLLKRCAEMSESARLKRHCHLNVPYGQASSETLDIFRADGTGPQAPVEIFFHGGYWRMLDKRDFSYVADGFAPRGCTTVVVNYGLIPTVTLEQLVEQCRQAVIWVRRHIDEYGGDPSRIYLSGHSAGAHLVAMLLTTDWVNYDAGDPSSFLRGATLISGIYDLEPIRLSYLNKTLGFKPATVAQNSPVALASRVDLPLVVAVGSLEGDEYIRQSTSLTKAWAPDLAKLKLQLFQNEDHFSIRMQLGEPDSPLISLMMAGRPSFSS